MRAEDQLQSRNEPDVEPTEDSATTTIIAAQMKQADALPALAGKSEDLRNAATATASPANAGHPKVKGHTVAALIVIAAAIAGFIAYDLGETKFESLFSSATEDADADRSTGE